MAVTWKKLAYSSDITGGSGGASVRQTVRRSYTNYKGRSDFLWGGQYDFANMKEDYVNDAIGTYTSTYYPYLAFDGSDATEWISSQTGASVNGVDYVGMKNLKRNVKAIKYLNHSNAVGNVTSVKVQYSTDNGVTWMDIQTTTVVNTASVWNEFTVAEYASGNAGLHSIRLLANSGVTAGNNWGIFSIILLYDTNLDVCTTGNAIKYDENASYPATNAFDNTTGTHYESSANMSTGNTFLGQSGLTSAVKAVRIFTHVSDYYAKEVRLSWKQNVGDAWTDLATIALDYGSSWKTIAVPSYSPSGSHYFALRPTTNCMAKVWVVYELEFYTSVSNLNITASATDPLTMSLAYGLEDRTIEIDSDITDAWQSLTAGRSNFLFYKKDITTGAVSRDHTPIVPQYGYYFDKSRHSLLHFDGADTSTSIIDQYGHPWVVGGNAHISTTDPLFGSGKLVLDGTADYIRNTTLNICNARLFTFECWWSTSDKTTLYQAILGGGGALYAIATLLYYTGGNNYMLLYLSSNGSSSWSIASLTSAPISITNGVWYKHIVEFDGYYYRVWHGTETANMRLVCVLKSSSATYSANGIHVGSLYDTSNGLKGAIDEVRVTMDSNRYGWSPVAETAAFPTYDADIHYFDIPKMTMYKGDGSTGWTQVQRVFVGEAYTDAMGCISIDNYALNARYDTGRIATTAVTTTKNHLIGLEELVCTLQEGATTNSRTQIMSKDFTVSRRSVAWSAVAGTSKLLVQRGW